MRLRRRPVGWLWLGSDGSEGTRVEFGPGAEDSMFAVAAEARRAAEGSGGIGRVVVEMERV